MFKNIKYYLLLLLGLVIFLTFIWLRFLRERLPRDIPFYPRLFTLLLLLGFCMLYLSIIIVMYKTPKKNEIYYTLSNLIHKPLEVLDETIKTPLERKKKLESLLYPWINKLENPKSTFLLYYILPRTALIVVLSVDIYFYHQLDYIYSVLYLGIFILLLRYIKYSLSKWRDDQISKLAEKVSSVITAYEYGVHPSEWPENIAHRDEDEDDDIPPTMSLPLDVFINYQVSRIVNSLDPVEFYSLSTKKYYDDYKKQYNLTVLESEHYNHIRTVSMAQIDHLIKLALIIENYTMIVYEDKEIKIAKTLIFLNYFFCWFYILITSLYPAATFDGLIFLSDGDPFINP